MKDNTQEDQLIHEYLLSKGYSALEQLRKLESTYLIFNYNFQELDKLLSITKKNATVDTENIRNILNSFDLLFTKGPVLIFNFLSSSKALIDVTRTFVTKNYKNTNFEKMYLNKIKVTFYTQECKFIKEFRNYHTHVECPKYAIAITPIGPQNSNRFKYSFTSPDSDVTVGVVLYKEFCNYYKQVCKFYKWFYQEWKKYHKQDIIESKRIAKKIEKLYPADDKHDKMLKNIYIQPFYTRFNSKY